MLIENHLNGLDLEASQLSSTQRALNLEDILDQIFLFLRKHALARCTRVCKTWERPGSKLLWKDLNTLDPLLRLLGPLSRSPDNGRVFSSPTQSSLFENWARLAHYAPLVQSTTLYLSDGTSDLPWPSETTSRLLLHPQALCDVATVASIKGEPVLPSLKHLRVVLSDAASSQASALLLNNSYQLSSISISVTPMVQLDALYLLFQRVSRCQLTTLNVNHTPLDNPQSSHILVNPLKNLKRLERVELPNATLLNGDIWKAICGIDTLRFIRCLDFPDFQPTATNADEDANAPAYGHRLSLGTSLPALESVALCLDYHQAMGMWRNASLPSLKHAVIRLHSVPDTTTSLGVPHVGKVTRAISRAAPNLVQFVLTVDGRVALSREWLHEGIVSLKSLTRLELVSDGVSTLEDEDIRYLASSLPSLDTLILSPDPLPALIDGPNGQSHLTFLALSHIAEACPKMKRLGLFIDTSPDLIPSHTTHLYPFTPALRGLTFGLSPVRPAPTPDSPFRSRSSHPPELPQCLIRLLLFTKPFYIEFRAGNRRSGRGTMSDLRPRYDQVKSSWDRVMGEVEKMRPFVDAVRKASVHGSTLGDSRAGS